MTRTLLASMLIVLASSAMAQGQVSLNQLAVPAFQPRTLPMATYDDLLSANDTTGPISVRGFDQPLSPELSEAVRQTFNVESAGDRVIGAQMLEELSRDDPAAATILGSAINDRWIIGGGQIPILAEAAQNQRDPVAQRALEGLYLQPLWDGADPALLVDSLNKRLAFGNAQGAESTLAQLYQYGLGVEKDIGRAEGLWLQATATDNPEALLGYAQFLTEQGRPEESARVVTRAALQGNPTAVADALRLALDGQGDRPLDEVLAAAETFAWHPEVALVLGDMARDAGDIDKAEQHYIVVTGPLAFPEQLRARGQSRLGMLYEGNAVHFGKTRSDLNALFDAAAAAGDADGLIGLANAALLGGDLQAAYELASRASELGDPDQAGRAAAIREQVCESNSWLSCVPVPVFFATTRLLLPGEPARFGISDQPNDGINFGIVFVSVPVDTAQFEGRARLFDAGKAEAVALFGADRAAAADSVGADEQLVLTGAEPAAWAAAAKRAADAIGADGAFVFVHGFNNPFDAATRATAETSERAGFPRLPIALSWSSRGKVERYVGDFTTAIESCSRLAAPFKAVGSQFGGSKMTVMAHSLGAQVVYDMIGGCSGNGSQWDPADPIDSLIYAAPDMTQEAFKRHVRLQIERAKHITIYVSTNDLALKASSSELLHDTGVRAGTGGDNVRMVEPPLETVDATDVEFTILSPAGDFFNHGYVFSRPEVIADLSQLLQLKYSALNRGACIAEAHQNEKPFFKIKKDCMPN